MQNQTSICCFDPGRALGEPSWLSLNQQDAEFSFVHQAVLLTYSFKRIRTSGYSPWASPKADMRRSARIVAQMHRGRFTTFVMESSRGYV
jgi:hypothetical protein